MTELKHIEDMHDTIMRLVYKGLGKLGEKEELNANDIKHLETLDKIVRAGLEIYGKKTVKSIYADKTDEDLLAELEG